MYCPNCGNNVSEEAAFCGSCGAPIRPEQVGQAVHDRSQPRQADINEEISFMTSYLTFYLKGKIDIRNDRVSLKIPNTIFGLFPLGSNERSIDVNQIVSPVSNFKVTPLTLILGFFIAFGGMIGIPESIACLPSLGPGSLFMSLVITAFGALLFLNSLQTTVGITLTSGEIIAIPLVIFEKEKANYIRDLISQICATRTHDTNTRIHTEHQTSQIIDAIHSRA